MKKFLACLAVFTAMMLMVSCGGGSKTGDNTNTGDTTTDNDTGDSGSTDTEPSSDTEPTENPDSDNPDTTPDNDADSGDTVPDSDNGDSAPDSDDGDTANENPDNLPECSPTSATPCIDSETGLIWSGKAPERIRWIDAVDHCKNLKEGGYNDWKLPTIAALETLVKQCESSGYSDGECSKLGDIVFFWSGTNTGTEASGVFFYNGATQTKNVDETFDARCVRRDRETRNVNCTGIPEQHAKWNSVSEITQTWDWSKASWIPASNIAYYEEESSTTECRFKCDKNYFFDSCSGCVDHYTGLTDDCAQCPSKNILLTAEQLQNSTAENIQEYTKSRHDNNKSNCPHGSFTEKEIYDAKGNLCIEDICNINSNEIVSAYYSDMVWIDDLLSLIFEDSLINGKYWPSNNIIYYKHQSNGNLTDLTVKRGSMTVYAKDVPTTSCFFPNNIIEDATTATMRVFGGCRWGSESISPSNIIATKNIQPKSTETEFKEACKKLPNSKYDSGVNAKTCSTTITEFVWLENVLPYLHNKSGFNDLTSFKNYYIEKDLDNNVFRMYFINNSYTPNRYWVVELPNAKRCLDECYGIEGCEVSIYPSSNLSEGCNVKKP